VLIVLKSGSLKILEHQGPVQACNGIALPFSAPGSFLSQDNYKHFTYSVGIIFLLNGCGLKWFVVLHLCNEASKVKEFLLNNQTDALIIPILFCYKTLHVLGIFSALHQEFSAVHSALVSFMQVSDGSFQAESVPS
jgi:hypothetical protein